MTTTTDIKVLLRVKDWVFGQGSTDNWFYCPEHRAWPDHEKWLDVDPMTAVLLDSIMRTRSERDECIRRETDK